MAYLGAGKMALWLKVLALPETWVGISAPTWKFVTLQFQGIQSPMWALHAHGALTYMQANTYTHKITNKSLKVVEFF